FVYLLKYFNKKAGEFEYEELLTNAAILILLVSYAAIMASNEFERYARVGYILIYILFFNFISKRTIDINIRFLMTILFTLSMGSYIYFQYFFRASDQIPFFEAIFKTVLEYNSVIGIYNE
ncbi:MAG: hypothetical protein Q4D05_07940, partial [Acinetobacter sp.]|nr:hypothetical protein [Acinetobacter sp.]